MSNVVIFARVSTLQQDNERQVQELTSLVNQQGKKLIKVFQEKISGKAATNKRTAFNDMLEYCKTNNVNEVYCWELSRLGRKSVEVLKAIETLKASGVNLYIHNFAINTLDSDGKTSLLGGFMLQILSAVYEMESSQIKQRLVSGYNKHVNEGGKVGRSKNWKEDKDVFLNKHIDVSKLLKKEYSVRAISQLTGKSSATIQKVKKTLLECA